MLSVRIKAILNFLLFAMKFARNMSCGENLLLNHKISHFQIGKFSLKHLKLLSKAMPILKMFTYSCQIPQITFLRHFKSVILCVHIVLIGKHEGGSEVSTVISVTIRVGSDGQSPEVGGSSI